MLLAFDAIIRSLVRRSSRASACWNGKPPLIRNKILGAHTPVDRYLAWTPLVAISGPFIWSISRAEGRFSAPRPFCLLWALADPITSLAQRNRRRSSSSA
jgi:hypothetical protein